jgi:hypothetical protein
MLHRYSYADNKVARTTEAKEGNMPIHQGDSLDNNTDNSSKKQYCLRTMPSLSKRRCGIRPFQGNT